MTTDVELKNLICQAENPDTDPDDLWDLSTHPNSRVRAAVARNPATSEVTLDELSKTTEAGVLASMAANPEYAFHPTPAEVTKFAPIVRRVMSVMPHTGPIILDQLAKDPTLCYNVAGNIGASSRTLLHYVNPDYLSTIPGVNVEQLHFIMTRNPKAPAPALRAIHERYITSSASDYPEPFLASLLSNLRIPSDILRRYGTEGEYEGRRDITPDVKWAVYSNPVTPMDVLTDGARNETNGTIASAARRNPVFPQRTFIY